MIFQVYTIFIVPLVLSLFLTPLMIRVAKRIGAIDQPNERKVHKLPIPRLGGLSIYLSFFVSFFAFSSFNLPLHPFAGLQPHMGLMLVISLTIVLIIGIVDDVHQLSPGKKFAGQFIAATIVYLAGFRISSITHPFASDTFHLGFLDFPATILWIVGITNAFNLIDGLDGLASGVAFIVSLTISSISFMKGEMVTAIMALMLAGSLLGFLRYNFNGAKIFLGDSGSLFIGFTLAILSMQSSTKGSAVFSLLVPVVTLGLPIMDTLLSMTRRFLRSVFPEDPEQKSFLKKMFTMFLPDRGHIHHQLIARGLSHQTVVLLLYVVSCLFGIGAFVITLANNISVTPILIAIGIATFIGVSQLRYKEMAVLRSGILLPLYEWPLVNSYVFKGFLDLAFIVAAYGASYYIVFAPQQMDPLFVRSLAVVCGVQLTVFYMGGLYKGAFRQLGIGDILKIFKLVTLSIVFTWIVLAFLPKPWNVMNVTMIILNFYFLLSLILGARVSFHVLNYLSKHGQQEGKRNVLIYGAGTSGILLLQQLLHDERSQFSPVGFLDSDPQLEGKRLNGYPIFGGHWKLARLLKTMDIKEVIVACDSVRPLVLKRMTDIAHRHGISIRCSHLQLVSISSLYPTKEYKQEQLTFAGK